MENNDDETQNVDHNQIDLIQNNETAENTEVKSIDEDEQLLEKCNPD